MMRPLFGSGLVGLGGDRRRLSTLPGETVECNAHENEENPERHDEHGHPEGHHGGEEGSPQE